MRKALLLLSFLTLLPSGLLAGTSEETGSEELPPEQVETEKAPTRDDMEAVADESASDDVDVDADDKEDAESGFVLEGTDEEKGLAIAREADRRNTGWGDSRAAMTMTLRNKNGGESIRNLRVKTLEVDGDGDKGLTIFDEPKDVQGTAFLSFSHAIEADDQWLYLPALKRVKRISSANKSGPFMGSEFAYEDLASFEIEKYEYKFVREDEVDGDKVYVVEMTPQYEYSGYTRQLAWIDQDEFRIRKIEFFDRKNAALKTLGFDDFKQYKDQYWRAHSQLMENHQNGKSTLLEWSGYEFDTGLTDNDFNKNSLKRAK